MCQGEDSTVSLITHTTYQDAHERWFDYLYLPPLHEYCHMPVAADEMITRLNKVLEVSANSVNGRDE